MAPGTSAYTIAWSTIRHGWQQRAADAAAAFFFEMLSLDTSPQQGRYEAANIQRSPAKPDQGISSFDIRFTIDQLRQFHNTRVSDIAGPKPKVPVLDGAILAMHLMPLRTFDAPQPSFAEISRNPRRFPPIVDTAPRDWKISADGLLTGSNHDGLAQPQRAYVYVFRSGAVETVVSNIARGHSRNVLQLPNIQSMIIHYARVYAASLDKFGVHPPLAIFVSLARVKNMRLLQDFTGSAVMEDLPYSPVTADVLHFDEAIFDTIPEDDNASAKILSPILDHLANAAGLATSPYFDADGNYTLKVACPAG